MSQNQSTTNLPISNGTLALSVAGSIVTTNAINLASSSSVLDVSGISGAAFTVTNANAFTGVAGSSAKRRAR